MTEKATKTSSRKRKTSETPKSSKRAASAKAGSAKTTPVKTARAKATTTKTASSKTAVAKTATAKTGRQYWLFKSEPDKFSWDALKAKGAKGEEWDGVRNYQARNNMRQMNIGDLGFFYHSNAGKDIVGIAEVCARAHPDSTTDDERWECVDIRAVCDVPKPVTLADIKQTESLAEMSLVTSMRLSVQPVRPNEWDIVCKMAGLNPKKLPRK